MLDICKIIKRSNNFDTFDKMLTGLQLSFELQSPYLKTDVIFAFFNIKGNVEFLP